MEKSSQRTLVPIKSCSYCLDLWLHKRDTTGIAWKSESCGITAQCLWRMGRTQAISKQGNIPLAGEGCHDGAPGSTDRCQNKLGHGLKETCWLRVDL